MEFKTIVKSQDGKIQGEVIDFGEEGGYCEIEDCLGHQWTVQWNDGDITEVCTHGLQIIEETEEREVYQIL